MKVPFLNKRIEKEFSSFLKELSASVTKSVGENKANTQESKLLFSNVFPLFVLLRCLSTPTYTRDPSKDAILSELRNAGRKNEFISALLRFNRKKVYQNELVQGLQKQIFTGYFDELFSDTLLLLNSFYTYNYRGAMVAVRCMLEDLYRHLYYRDHPQEFWALTEGGYSEYELGLKPSKFRNFLPQTNYLSIFKSVDIYFLKKADAKNMDLFSLNEKLYSESSSYVHGSEFSSLNSFRSNSDLEKNIDREKTVLRVVNDFVKVSVAFLVAAHFDHILAANEYEKSIILSAFSDQEKINFRFCLNI